MRPEVLVTIDAKGLMKFSNVALGLAAALLIATSAQAQYVGSTYTDTSIVRSPVNTTVNTAASSAASTVQRTTVPQTYRTAAATTRGGVGVTAGGGPRGGGATVSGGVVTRVGPVTLPVSGAVNTNGQWRLNVGGLFGFGNGGAGGMFGGSNAQIDDRTCRILTLVEGSFGALAMVVAGLIAIVAAAMGSYRMALSCIVIGAGSWVLYPIVTLFFGDILCAIF